MSLNRPADIAHLGGRLALFILLVAVLLLALPTGSVFAQDEEAQAADVDREAYYTQPLSAGLPPAVMREFPHAVVCIVAPDACSEQMEPLNNTVHGVIVDLADALDSIPQPVQPVVPGTLPVGMFGGKERYASALRFTLPPVPEGQMITKLELLLTDSGASFSLESPAFRRLIRATIAQYTDGPSPEPFIQALERAASEEEPLLSTDITGVEVCPITEPWEAGEDQPGEELPERDCILGGTGTVEEDGSWVFDLTFAAESWRQGDLENHGIILAPLGAPNLEFGDPDYSTNFVMAFAGSEAEESERPRLRVVFDEDFTTEFPLDPPLDSAPGPAPPALGNGFGLSPDVRAGFDDPDPTPESRTDDAAPDVADEALAAEERQAFPLPPEVWLLLPVVLGGGWWFARVADLQPATQGARTGALSRISRGA